MGNLSSVTFQPFNLPDNLEDIDLSELQSRIRTYLRENSGDVELCFNKDVPCNTIKQGFGCDSKYGNLPPPSGMFRFFDINNNVFWFIFAVITIGMVFLPSLLRQIIPKSSILQFWGMNTMELTLMIINVILFAIVSLLLFKFKLSKDIERVIDSNLQLYNRAIRIIPGFREEVLDSLNTIIENNQDTYNNYQEYKSRCNSGYLGNGVVYIGILAGLLILYLFIMSALNKFNMKEAFNKDTMKTFWISVFLITIVFSTELYMLFFVFTKISLVGEIDLHYKILKSIEYSL
jgi:hypothetical protein